MTKSKNAEIAFFNIDDDGWILGNDAARGPWTENGCHGGPVAGFLSRAAEQAVPDKQLVRITIDLCRPSLWMDSKLIISGLTTEEIF